jgi:hypothetical protein
VHMYKQPTPGGGEGGAGQAFSSAPKSYFPKSVLLC